MDQRVRTQTGVTLLELILVLLMTALLSVSAVMSFQGGEVFSLRGHADQLASDVRYLQARAMTHGARYRLNFATDRYWFTDRLGTTTYPHPATGQAQTTLASGTVVSWTQAFIVFDGNGAPYTTDTLPGTPLSADAVITLTAAGASYQVRISPETGRVIVQ